jgi:hypothetical protein
MRYQLQIAATNDGAAACQSWNFQQLWPNQPFGHHQQTAIADAHIELSAPCRTGLISATTKKE